VTPAFVTGSSQTSDFRLLTGRRRCSGAVLAHDFSLTDVLPVGSVLHTRRNLFCSKNAYGESVDCEPKSHNYARLIDNNATSGQQYRGYRLSDISYASRKFKPKTFPRDCSGRDRVPHFDLVGVVEGFHSVRWQRAFPPIYLVGISDNPPSFVVTFSVALLFLLCRLLCTAWTRFLRAPPDFSFFQRATCCKIFIDPFFGEKLRHGRC
jgi:hypothetical protein